RSFFNGGRELPFELEERVLVPSPQHVPTYDLAPEMSAAGIRDAVLAGLANGDAKLVVVNFANADMVGHTGVISAAVAGIEAVDGCMGPTRPAGAAGARSPGRPPRGPPRSCRSRTAAPTPRTPRPRCRSGSPGGASRGAGARSATPRRPCAG